ncbi:myosin head-domain-containing protein [Boletus reticuloceps]|uniref:Myosin head-domain-containing protein n=1 Tax=Boletus reticuloceps TaxID=495285 RepID=A0A8I2YV91_9AGAM|nr:myosin head-domain-containing protein [Boletus reticuloceps]
MTGASPEERQHLRLTDKTQYRYLGQHTGADACANGARDDNANCFEQLKMALKSIGLSKRQVAQTCQLVAAMLHLGNIELTMDRGRDVDAAVVRNVDVLGIVAEFLGVQPSALESTLAYKTKLVNWRRFVLFFLMLMVSLTIGRTLPRHFTLFFFPGTYSLGADGCCCDMPFDCGELPYTMNVIRNRRLLYYSLPPEVALDDMY